MHGSRSSNTADELAEKICQFLRPQAWPLVCFKAELGCLRNQSRRASERTCAITQSVDMALCSSFRGRFGRGRIGERQSGRLQSVKFRVGKRRERAMKRTPSAASSEKLSPPSVTTSTMIWQPDQ